MTNLQALQAMLEYENDNLLTKVLTDRGMSGSSTYSASNQSNIELAAADVYLTLCNHPDFREGSKYVDYSKGALMSLRREILRKWGQLPDTIITPGIGNAYANPQLW